MKDVRTIMKKMLYSMMASIVFVVSFATFALAQDAMVGGTWNVTMNIPGSEPRKYPLVLKQEGTNLSVDKSAAASAMTGTIKGNDFTLKYMVKFQDNDLAITMTGKVMGDEIKGDVDFGGMAQETWTAKKAAGGSNAAAAPAAASSSASSAGAANSWSLNYKSPEGEFPVILTVASQDGEKISGMADVKGPRAQKVPFTGTLKGDAVELKIVIKYEGNDMPITSKGKIMGNEVKGKVDYGGLAEGEFTGKKN